MTDIKDFILQLEDTTLSLEEQQAALAMIEKSLIENKQIQEKTLEENSNLIVDAVKEVEKKLENRFIALRTDSTLKGAKGDKGNNGKDGKDGKPGVDGKNGKDGKDGVDGKDGEDGLEAPRIIDAEVALDDTLLLTLSDGTEIKTTKPVVGERGSNGSNGPRGDKGDTGVGIAVGGTTGQVLTKVSNTDYDTTWTTPSGGGGSGTVTSVAATAGTGISVTGSPITTSGTLNITNTAPDQIVAIASGTGISVTGTYPNFSIANTAPSSGGTVTSITAGTGLTGGTITSSGTIAIDSTVTTNSGTQTLTNKRVNPRAVAAGSTSGTLTPNGDTTDVFNAFGLTGAITVDTPSGTPVDGQRLMLRFEDNGTGRGITWTGTSGAYRAVGVTLPTTTVASKVIYVGCVYNSTDIFWDAIAVASQA
jgi:hypothetical protein